MPHDENHRFTAARKSGARYSKPDSKFDFAFRVSLVLLIFLSIVPYASERIWTEAAVCAAIFILYGADVLRPRGTHEKHEDHRVIYPLLILAVYSFAQGLIALLTSSSSPAFLPRSYDSAASFSSALKILAIALFIKMLLDNFRRNTKLLIFGVICTGSVFALTGIIRYFLQSRFPAAFGYFLFPELTPGVGFGTFINQNHFAYLMLMTLGLNFYLFRRGKFSKQLKAFFFAGSLLCWTALIFTASRGGIISSFGLIAFALFFSVGSRSKDKDSPPPGSASRVFFHLKKLATLAVVSLILIGGVIFIGQERVVTRFEKLPLQLRDISASPTYLRIDVYRAALESIKENPLFGTGFGSFRYGVARYIRISGDVSPEQAHNDYLEYAASGGLIAASIAVWFVFIFISLVRKNLKNDADAFEKAARGGAICGIIGISIHNLFDFGLQIFANALFLAALIAIAAAASVEREPARIDGENETAAASAKKTHLISKALAALCLLLAGYSITFGLLRYRMARADAANYAALPFDAEFYAKKALISREKGNHQAALHYLEKAIALRPVDYSLHLQAAQTNSILNRKENAAHDFRKAVELAPYFSVPRYLYGKFLFENENQPDGLRELRRSFRDNPKYFQMVTDYLWRKTGKSAAAVIEMLYPINMYETAMLNIFFYEEGAYSSMIDVVCRSPELPRAHLEALAQRLLEKRRYYLADRVYKRDCADLAGKSAAFENGDFALDQFAGGVGFGWRVGDLPDNVEIGTENDKDESGNFVLAIDFNGAYDPAMPLVTQLLTVEKKQKYEISFSYRSSGIMTGGVPVIYLIPKNTDFDEALTEAALSPGNTPWIRKTIEIETGGATEAIEVRLARKDCGYRICPIFGRLRLADFKIRKK